MRVAIIHEWLDTYGGSERVVEQMLACFPEADVFAVCDFLPEAERAFLGGRTVRTSMIQRLPFARRRFRHYLGLMPFAVEQFDLAGYDLVLSSSHAVAKGVITGPGQTHVCYVHSPMRYIWDLQGQYLRQAGLDRGPGGLAARWLFHRLRQWDRLSAAGVDHFVANSAYIAERIRKVWRREAEVLHPPVDLDAFRLAPEKPGPYLVAGRFVPYKRVDLIARAFRALPQHPLLIVGDGPERNAVQAAAAGAPNITLQPPVPRAELIGLMQQARAVVFAAEEDFGITMVEAQACGTPVIGFGRGGARDILPAPAPGRTPTGLLFEEQTEDAIIAAVQRFEAMRQRITPEACRRNALRFGIGQFRDGLRRIVSEAMDRPAPPAEAPRRIADG